MLQEAIVPYLIQMMETLLFGSLTIVMFTEGCNQQITQLSLMAYANRRPVMHQAWLVASDVVVSIEKSLRSDTGFV